MKSIPGKILILSIVFLFAFITGIVKYSLEKEESAFKATEIEITNSDRILILAPHPDDEILGCAGIIQKASKMKLPLQIVFLTYGDNNEWSFILYRKRPILIPKSVRQMGQVRYIEAIEAGKSLGVSESQLKFLGYPDFRTLNIWYSHWNNKPPVKSMLTKVKKVPYGNAFRPGAPYKGEEIVKDLKEIILQFKPTKIFLSHPADHNPDHRALYLFTNIALWDIESELKPELYPYLIHYKKWPKPRGYLPALDLIPPKSFLTGEIKWYSNELSLSEIERKWEAIKKHHSQYMSARKYLTSFIRKNELFGDFDIIKLNPNTPPAVLRVKTEEEIMEMDDELAKEEEAIFTVIEESFVSIEDKNLIINTQLSRSLGEKVGHSIFVFGYRSDISFKKMPKIHIVFGPKNYKVFNQDILISNKEINVERKIKEIKIYIPLNLLDNPTRILTGAKTYTDKLPLDWIAWRVIEIE